MTEFLARSQPSEIITLVAILAAALVGFTALVSWRHVRQAQVDSALKQEMLRHGLSAEDVERLTGPAPRPAPRNDDNALREVAGYLAAKGFSGADVEQTLALVRAADLATKQAVCAALDGMFETSNPTQEQVLGAVRGLCGAPVRPSAQVERVAAAG
jgi:hypothetical protein